MKSAKKLWDAFTTLLVAVVVIAAILLVGVRLVGLQPFTVLSGSMEPTYHTGSLIYVKPVDCRELKVGDPISFMLDEDTVATHRIIEVIPDPEDPGTIRYRTKGDANEAPDGGLVHFKNIIGVPVASIPKLGYLASYVQNPPGTYIALCVGAFAILLMFLPELVKAFTSDDNSGENKKEAAPPAEEDEPRRTSAHAERSHPSRKLAPASQRKKGRHEH